MSDFDWQNFFVASSPSSRAQSKVALSIFDSPDSFQEQQSKESPKESPKEEKPKGQPAKKTKASKWNEFMDLFYEGGHKKVKNPNPKTKDKYPEVVTSTALKDKLFYAKLIKEFHAWAQKNAETPEEAKPHPFSEAKPGDVFYEKGFEKDPITVDKVEEEDGQIYLVSDGVSYHEQDVVKDSEGKAKLKSKSEQPKIGDSITSVDQISPKMYFKNQWGVVGRVTSLTPSGGIRYCTYDKVFDTWSPSKEIKKESLEEYLKNQSFEVVEPPEKEIPEGAKVTHASDVTPGDTIWFNEAPRVVKKVGPGPYEGQWYQLEDGTWINQQYAKGPELEEEEHSYVYHKPGKLHPEKPKEPKEKADVGDSVTKSSQLVAGDWLSSKDTNGPDVEHIGKITEVTGLNHPQGPGVMIQDFDPKSQKLRGKPWFIPDSDLNKFPGTKIEAKKVKKGLTGKEVKDPNTLKNGDVLRIHEYSSGDTNTAQVISNEDGWVAYAHVNPKTGKVGELRVTPHDEFSEKFQVSRLPKSKVPKKIQDNPDQTHAKSLIKKKTESGDSSGISAEGLTTDNVDWDDIKSGDLIHTKKYGPQLVSGLVGNAVQLESGVWVPRKDLVKDGFKFVVSRGHVPQKTTGPLKNLHTPTGWNQKSRIAQDANRFLEQYKEILGDTVTSIVNDMPSGKQYWHGTDAMWDNMSEGERKLAQSGHKAANEFKKLLTDKEWDEWREAIASWQGSSGGSSAHMLMGALGDLGIEGKPKSFEVGSVEADREEGRRNKNLRRALSKAMAYSQLVYDTLGIDHVTLYRGTQTKAVQEAEPGKHIKTDSARELASFSIDPQVAYEFSSKTSIMPLGKVVSKRAIRYRVPTSRLFISPITFAPLSSAKKPFEENEYAVAGQDGLEGTVMPKEMGDIDPSLMKAARVRRPLFGPIYDDDVLLIEFEPEDDDWLRSPVKETWWPSYCHQHMQWQEENEPRVASKILRLARENPQFRHELLASLRSHKKIAVSIFDAPETVSPSEAAPSSGGDSSFEEWFSKKYDGGKKKVKNPNPKTKGKYPEVSVSTAMKDQVFADKIRAEYHQESSGAQEEGGPSLGLKDEEVAPSPPPKLEEEPGLKPSDLKIGDKLRYTYKGSEFIGQVVSSEDGEIRATIHDPKTGKRLRFKPISFDEKAIKEHKMERADDWQPPKKEEVPKHLDIDSGGWKPVGPQRGSNPGGLYENEKGQQYYVKTPKTEDRARNEILAGKLYKLTGIKVPELTIATLDGKPSVASKIIPGLHSDDNALRSGKVPGVLEGIAVDAWLSNWDVVGLDYDNLLVDEEGNGRRVDTGGALRYRAMGSPKGDAFGDEVTELKVFTNPNQKSGSVLSHATPQQIVDSIDRVLAIPEGDIHTLVEEWGPTSTKEREDLFKTLLARRESLKEQRKEYEQKASESKKMASRVLQLSLSRPAFRKAFLQGINS